MNATQQTISTDTALRLLSDTQRRRILQILCDRGGAGMVFGDIAAELDDGDTTSDPSSGSTTSDVYVALYHSHLPKLAKLDVITWNRDRNLVTPGPAFAAVESVLGVLRRNADELPTGLFSGN